MDAAIDPIVGWVARAGMALLFAVAAWHKLRDPRAFTASVRAYRLLPDALATAIAPLLIAAEAAGAIALMLPGGAPLAGAVLAGLLGLSSGGIAINLARGRRDVDCGCLGPGRRARLAPWLLVRNAALLVAVAVAAAPTAARPLMWIDALTLIAGFAACTAIYAAAHALAERHAALASPAPEGARP